MNRLSLLGVSLVAALSINAAAADVVNYDFTTIENLDGWQIVDVNDDSSTWKFDADNTTSRVYYYYHRTNTADDWLITPAITLPSTGNYCIQVSVQGNNYIESMELWSGSQQSVAGMTDKLLDMPEIDGDTHLRNVFIQGTAGQVIYLGMHATSGPDRFRMFLKNLKVFECANPVDLAVTDFVSPVSGENLGQETVTVNIKNNGIAAAQSFDVSYQLNNGAVVTETVNQPLAGGATMQYSFAAKADMSVSHCTYNLSAWTTIADDLDTTNDKLSTQIQHIGPAVVPYYTGFEPNEDFSGFQYLNLNNDSGEWSVETNGWFNYFSRTGDGFLGYNYDSANNGDDWVFIDPIEMQSGYYSLKFWYSATQNHTEKFKVMWGNQPTPEAMTNLIVDYDAVSNSNFKESINVFQIPTDQRVYIGFYCYSNKNENWLIIDDLSIDRVQNTDIDVMADEIKHPWDFVRETNKKDVDFTVRNLGITDVDANVKIFIDDNLANEYTYPLGLLENKTISAPGLLNDLAEGQHTLKIEISAEGDNNIDNNVVEHSFTVLPVATRIWDFEDGVIPSTFTMAEYDGGTVNPNAGDEFNELGWGIFNLQHYMLGTRSLAGTSWLDGTYSADRWLILPQVHVTDENAYLAWDAHSYNPNFLETYRIMVNEFSQDKGEYSTGVTITAESASPKTRGFSLAPYKDKNVCIAYRLETESGEALILDNIGLHGGVSLVVSDGVNEIANGNIDVVINANGIIVNNTDNAVIEIFDAKGAAAAHINGNHAEFGSLTAGIYIARITTAEGVVTRKFIVK